MPITHIYFSNFKVFRDATLPLRRTTLLVGPNGSGKTTALRAIRLLATPIGQLSSRPEDVDPMRSVGVAAGENASLNAQWDTGEHAGLTWLAPPSNPYKVAQTGEFRMLASIANSRLYSFDHDRIATESALVPAPIVDEFGAGLPAVLTNLQDQHPERFESLNKDFSSLLPEFDRVLLDTPHNGHRAFVLRTRVGSHRIPTKDISQGTLFALVLLTLGHLPNPPQIVGLEDPDRGMHPRLLRDMLAATERLSNPEAFGDERQPVQVVMTTHSPYLVDLFKDRPEDVVLIEKTGLWSKFKPLLEIPDIREILNDSHLGEAWFSGTLGGVPANS